jgi:hypothetical protein
VRRIERKSRHPSDYQYTARKRSGDNQPNSDEEACEPCGHDVIGYECPQLDASCWASSRPGEPEYDIQRAIAST